VAPHIRSHRAPCSCFPEKVSLQLSSEQSVGDVGITQLDWKRVAQARSRGCKSSVAITECSRHHARSASDGAAADRRLLHHSSPVCSRPRHLRRLRPVDVDTRPTYRVAILRRATSTTSDSSLCAVGHTTDARGCTAALPAGLWERRAGRPFNFSQLR